MAPDATRSTGAMASRQFTDQAAMPVRSSLIDGLERLGIVASTSQVDALLQFVALLAKWGRVYNLTAVRDPQDMMVIHLLDSLAILPLVDRIAPQAIVDVGSGAGLPSIPLAILRPRIDIVSVDAVAKKVGFQIQARAALGLARLKPLHARIEALSLDHAPSLIVSRAFATLATMLASVDHLATPATTILAMKGARPNGELAALPPAWIVDDVVPLDVPFLGAERCAVLLRRAAS